MPCCPSVYTAFQTCSRHIVSSDTLWYCYIFLSHVGYIRFSLRGITYQNNSLVTLEDIGEGDGALLCITEQIRCCRGPSIGNWFFPNGTGVPNRIIYYGIMWEFYRNRSNMVLHMHRRRGGDNGIYHCEIPDTAGVHQIIYIGVYTAGTGEQYKIYLVWVSRPIGRIFRRGVTWMSNLHKHTRLGGSGGMLPHEIFRN